MSPRFAILCPGQGGQHAAMFDLARTDATTETYLQRALAGVVQQASLEVILNDDERLFSNRYAQPLIVAAGLAIWHLIKDHVPLPSMVAGYSIGELTAYGIAGALSSIDLVDIAARRATLMDECMTDSGNQLMLAVSGLHKSDIAMLANEHALHVAIETGNDSVIVGGAASGTAGFQAAIADRGGRCSVLPVHIAAHTPLITAAVDPFAATLNTCQFSSFKTPVLAGISARPVTQKADAVETLSRQLAEKIRWLDCMDMLAESGITVALEIGPGSALSRLLQNRHPHIACRSIADFRSVAGLTQWVQNKFQP